MTVLPVNRGCRAIAGTERWLDGYPYQTPALDLTSRDGVFVRHITPARARSTVVHQRHRVEIIHPFALQSLSSSCSILCAKPAPSSGWFSRIATTSSYRFQRRTDQSHRCRPTARFARQRLKYWRIVGILKSDRNGTRFHQRIAKIFRVRAGWCSVSVGSKAWQNSYLSVVKTVACGTDVPKRFPTRKASN